MIPAATLIVLRPAAAGPPEILVVERAAGMAFAGGATVFPGGRIDDADHALAARLGHPDAAAKITALRETVEESAVAPGLVGALDPSLGPRLQTALLGGMPFADVLDAHCLTVDLAALTAFARWSPAFNHARRFDTLFYLVAAPAGDCAPVPQPGECAAAYWISAAALLARIASGDAHAIFPTKRNLERLARFDSLAAAIADASAFPLDTIRPWIEQRADGPHVCIPADRGYPVTSEPMTSAIRA